MEVTQTMFPSKPLQVNAKAFIPTKLRQMPSTSNQRPRLVTAVNRHQLLKPEDQAFLARFHQLSSQAATITEQDRESGFQDLVEESLEDDFSNVLLSVLNGGLPEEDFFSKHEFKANLFPNSNPHSIFSYDL
jgi:hypothetical protein